jgi:hypothetical protein
MVVYPLNVAEYAARNRVPAGTAGSCDSTAQMSRAEEVQISACHERTFATAVGAEDALSQGARA